MKTKLAENLPGSLKWRLGALGHDVHTVYDEGLNGRTDALVSGRAQRELRFLITQDLDFSDTRRFVPGSHNGVLVLRLRHPGVVALTRRVSEIFTSEDTGSWHGCLVVASEMKVPVTRPGR